eukprot:scaffold15_cov234-Pinguiococcus_pyrenoidosus.AAC.6
MVDRRSRSTRLACRDHEFSTGAFCAMSSKLVLMHTGAVAEKALKKSGHQTSVGSRCASAGEARRWPAGLRRCGTGVPMHRGSLSLDPARSACSSSASSPAPPRRCHGVRRDPGTFHVRQEQTDIATEGGAAAAARDDHGTIRRLVRGEVHLLEEAHHPKADAEEELRHRRRLRVDPRLQLVLLASLLRLLVLVLRGRVDHGREADKP